jgi:hypothetical protein
MVAAQARALASPAATEAPLILPVVPWGILPLPVVPAVFLLLLAVMGPGQAVVGLGIRQANSWFWRAEANPF